MLWQPRDEHVLPHIALQPTALQYLPWWFISASFFGVFISKIYINCWVISTFTGCFKRYLSKFYSSLIFPKFKQVWGWTHICYGRMTRRKALCEPFIAEAETDCREARITASRNRRDWWDISFRCIYIIIYLYICYMFKHSQPDVVPLFLKHIYFAMTSLGCRWICHHLTHKRLKPCEQQKRETTGLWFQASKGSHHWKYGAKLSWHQENVMQVNPSLMYNFVSFSKQYKTTKYNKIYIQNY